MENKNSNRSRNISGKVKKKVMIRDNGKCVYCGSKENIEFDHILPFSEGGSNSANNIQLICIYCNRQKRNYINDDFLRKEGKTEKKERLLREIKEIHHKIEVLGKKITEKESKLIKNEIF